MKGIFEKRVYLKTINAVLLCKSAYYDKLIHKAGQHLSDMEIIL